MQEQVPKLCVFFNRIFFEADFFAEIRGSGETRGAEKPKIPKKEKPDCVERRWEVPGRNVTTALTKKKFRQG